MLHLNTIKNETRHIAEQAVEQLKRVPVATVQRGLLVLTTACAALSLIPPLRLAGSLALRSVALLSSGANCAQVLQQKDKMSLATHSGKVALVALGLIGVLAASPVLIGASMVANLGLNLFEMGRAVAEGKTERALCQLGAVLIDTLAVGAFVTGSWGVMATAGVVSGFVMMILAVKVVAQHEQPELGNFVDFFCYCTFSLVGIVTPLFLASSPATYKHIPLKYHYLHRNPAPGTALYSDNTGRIIGSAPSGQTIHLEVKAQNSLNGSIKITDANGASHLIRPKLCEHQTIETRPYQPALAASEFPKLPIGGTAVVTKDLR